MPPPSTQQEQKGVVDISRIFRKVEESHETNLLDSLSKSLNEQRDSSNVGGLGGDKSAHQRMVALEHNLLASATLDLLDDDENLLLNEDTQMSKEQEADSDILNMLDDDDNCLEFIKNDDDENVPDLCVTPPETSTGIDRLKNIYGAEAMHGSLSVISEEQLEKSTSHHQWILESFSAASSKHQHG